MPRREARLLPRSLPLVHKRKIKRAGRRAKPGPRAASGRLSEAAAVIQIDHGSRFAARHRLMLCNDGDQALAASPLGILLANDLISREQRRAGERYGAARAITFGMARPSVGPDMLEPYDPPARSDGHLMKARERFERMAVRLDPDQKRALDVVAVDGKLPVWFRMLKAGQPLRPGDVAERTALLSGLDRLAEANR